jgi:murein DD-endopeptidase MepM/ murein hydrolase activator NlpD
VKIKHINGYVTSYGHLSRFASGIRSGKKVIQGQVIGYVGATGLATGPHLDFRILKNGKYLNFLKLELPRGIPVQPAYLNEFKKVKNVYAGYLQALSQNSENRLVFFMEPSEEEKVVSSS